MENHREVIEKGSLTLTGYKDWSITRAGKDEYWEAWLRDPSDNQTGAPLFSAAGMDSLVALIEAFEMGQRGDQ